VRGTIVYKMTGSGNDFVVLDGRATDPAAWSPDRIVELCDRRTGVGGDGLVILSPETPDSVRMDYWNSDGSRAAMCGNAALCSARLAVFLELVEPGEGSDDHFRRAVELSTVGFDLYRQGRGIATIYEVRDAVAAHQPYAYIDVLDPLGPENFTDRRPWLPDAFPDELPSSWTWGVSAAVRLVGVLVRSLADRADAPDSLRSDLAMDAARLSAIRRGVTDAYGHSDLPPGDAAHCVILALADDVYRELDVCRVVSELVNHAVTRFAADWPGRVTAPLRVLQAALCVEVSNGVGSAVVNLETTPIFDFARMGISHPPPMFEQSVAQAENAARERIGHPSTASSILYGTRLSHFAAFGRQDWRKWDWTWGRIHAVVHLAALLDLPPEQVDELVTLVVAAEGTTVADVDANIARVIGASSGDLIAMMKADGLLPPTIEAVFALLGSTHPTMPNPPVALRWLAALGSPNRPAALQARQIVARVLVAPLRWFAQWKLISRRRRSTTS